MEGSIEDKVKHVIGAKQIRDHACHWIGCTTQVAPAFWGCRRHWFMLPKSLRNEIWRTYKIGQEDNLNPSAEYIDVARRVQTWIKNFQAKD